MNIGTQWKKEKETAQWWLSFSEVEREERGLHWIFKERRGLKC